MFSIGRFLMADLIFVIAAAMAALVAPAYRLLMARRGQEAALPRLFSLILSLSFGLSFAAVYCLNGVSLDLFYLLLMAVVSVLVFITDLRHRLIPNPLILAILIITALFALAGMAFDWLDSLLGMAACLLIFMLPAFWGKNIGMGDIKLAGALGFAGGLMGGLYTVVLMGLMILAWLYLRRIPLVDYLKTLIPMGPCMSVAFMAVLVFRWF